MFEIRCGNRLAHRSELPEYHRTVEGVRRCYNGTAFECTWAMEVPTEDGPVVRECYDVTGAMAWETDRGWECESGHEHVRDDVRQREGWEYCEDRWDAENVMRGGRLPVAMNGGSFSNWA